MSAHHRVATRRRSLSTSRQLLKNISDGKKAERRLGLLLDRARRDPDVRGDRVSDRLRVLAQSLQTYDLALPGISEVRLVLATTSPVLTDGYWWTAFSVTHGITVISVIIEFVLGLAIALVMHRTIFGSGLVRTVVLIPYGIVTVAAAYSWYYAWTPGTGYLANLLPDGRAPLTEQFPSLAIIVLAEVWKTTPFMALLLLAGSGVGARRPAQGGPGRRRGCMDPADAHHHSADEAGHPRRGAVPHARRVPHLRQHLRAHQGSNDTGSVSILGYDNLFSAFNLGSDRRSAS